MNIIKGSVWGIIILCLAGCDLLNHRKYHDSDLSLQKEDYQRISKPPCGIKNPPPFHPRYREKKSPILPSSMKKRISISFQESAPLKSIFVELARQAGVGMALKNGPEFENSDLIYSAQNIPFIEVIKDICALTGHRFQIQGNRLLIEPDEPYLAVYNLQFLTNSRTSKNRIAVSTDVFAPMEKQSRSDNGSDSVLLANSLVDFWAELESNLLMILKRGTPSSSKSLPAFTFHKQGGLITVLGTAQQHKQVKDYLIQLKEATSTQVLIEAKIVEVSLDNEFKTGINWSQLGGDVHLTAPLGSISRSVESDPERDIFTLSVDHKNFSSVLSLLKKFGTVRTLSNPRLTVMNNQPAMLKVATNEVFFHLEFERYFQAEGKPDIENISSDPLTVPIGLVMVVQPSVDLNTGDITMSLRPTLSRVLKEVEDPAVAIKSRRKVKSTVPVIQVREMDSVLKMKSGPVIVMGGLMEDRSSSRSASVPIIDRIPFFGEFARGKDDDRKLTELVIFLTARIVEDSYIVAADERIYNTYTQDPRPLTF